MPSRKGVQARKISVCEEDISRDSIGAALSKKSSICDENDQKKKKDASILNDGIPACANDSVGGCIYGDTDKCKALVQLGVTEKCDLDKM